MIAALLYALVIWFVGELQRAKLMDNKELQDGQKGEQDGQRAEQDVNDLEVKEVRPPQPKNVSATASTRVKQTARKRKT